MKLCTTRERLLEVAMDLIWTESYGSVGVDEICRKTKIQKGSFYHFFPSKVNLAVAALSEAWEKHRPNVERLFSPDKEPLQRLTDYLAFSIEKQKALKERFGFFPGCPFTAIGIEQGANQEILRKTAENHLDFIKCYFEKTIKDAVRDGSVKVKNPAEKASAIFSLYLGAFTRLRITGDIGVMQDLQNSMRALLGLNEVKLKNKSKPVRKKTKRLVAA